MTTVLPRIERDHDSWGWFVYFPPAVPHFCATRQGARFKAWRIRRRFELT